jgi:organic hydroperoxide reductase OsmC/OhrA
MLWYLHLCADAGIVVTEYLDQATGMMTEMADGGGRFTRVRLRPRVTVREGADPVLCGTLHQRAGELCFIARSVAFPIDCDATTVVETGSVGTGEREG